MTRAATGATAAATGPAAADAVARTVLLYGAGGAPPAWGARVGAVPVPARRTDAPGDPLPASLAVAECALVDAESLDPLGAARRVHEQDDDVQVVVVVPDERRRALERALLFAPGVGEVWLVSPSEVVGAVAERAAGVTRQRRKFRRTRERLARERIAASPQRTERALISDAYLANLLHVLPDPVFSVDASGRVLSTNPAAAALLDPERLEVVGTPLAAAIGASDDAAVASTLAAAMEHPSRVELTFRRADGTEGHGELLARRVAGSEPPFFAVVLHDLTERHRTQRQLEEQAFEMERQAALLQDQAAELEQSNEVLVQQQSELEAALASRGRFYAAMSHELRTPLNAVMGYTGLALEGIYGDLAAPLRDALARAHRAAEHLHELVDDVLDLAKIEAGRIELATEPVDLAALAEDILLSVRPAAESEGTPLVLECRGGPSTRVVTDPRRVRQIVLNLLSNALKFGAGRPVGLRCAAAPGGVALSVVDQGVGIPANEQQRIFDEFVQLDPQAHRGTGLGLPISRRLAELLGGTLTVESAPGEGSTFTLTLPFRS